MDKWPHSPLHKVQFKGTYIVTGATYLKELFFKSNDQLTYFQDSLLEMAQNHQWQLQAWAIFPNHYHFVANSNDNSLILSKFIRILHGSTSHWLNQVENCPGRKVWYQYWDTSITHQRSYLARLNYVHTNPVRHGIVKDATDYKWCSASWFNKTAPSSFRNVVNSFKIDQVNVVDDF